MLKIKRQVGNKKVFTGRCLKLTRDVNKQCYAIFLSFLVKTKFMNDVLLIKKSNPCFLTTYLPCAILVKDTAQIFTLLNRLHFRGCRNAMQKQMNTECINALQAQKSKAISYAWVIILNFTSSCDSKTAFSALF